MDYILKEDKNWNIKAVILCISPIILEKYIKKLENEPFIKETEGLLLLDRTLTEGMKGERYTTAFYSYGKILPSSLRTIEPPDRSKNILANVYRENITLLSQSKFPDWERTKILKEIFGK